MRIVHLVHQYPPHFTGGTELYTQSLAAAQVAGGHHVALFTPSPETKRTGPTTAVDELGIQVYRFPVGQRGRTRVFQDTFYQRQLDDALRAVLQLESPDIVHIQHLMGMPSSMGQTLVAARIPTVVTLHDYWYVCANAQLLTNTDQTICAGPDSRFLNCAHCALARAGLKSFRWMAPLAAPLMGWRNGRLQKVLAQASQIIAPTEFVRQTYARLGVDTAHMTVVRHGIELPAEAIESARRKRSARPSGLPLHIGYIGSIGWQKGIHVLIAAVNALPEDQVRLTIYGGLQSFPEYVSQLRTLIRHPGIDLAGPVSRDDLWMALAQFDLLVMPTLWYEVSPLTIDEAFALGIPIVASDIGAMSEKISDDVNGRLVPPGDAAALARALDDIIANPERLAKWQLGIPPVRTIEDHVSEIEELYQSTLNTV